MRIIERVAEMQQQSDKWRDTGKKIALVPTMGYFHEGHLTLMRKVRNEADVVVTSIFVNPAQFGPNEDFTRYPRDLDRDNRLAAEAGVDVTFIPPVGEMYPDGYQTYLEVTDITRPLCGKSRPGHFRGVTTVVAKLFNIVKPHYAIFGEKDFQQLTAIRRMVGDMNFEVEIMGHPIVREPDDLAMSSRNVYLSSGQRKKALRLNGALKEAQALLDKGETDSKVILERVREVMEPDEEMRIDYAQLCRPDTLEEVDRITGPTLLALAAYVGKTRLIDNAILRLSA